MRLQWAMLVVAMCVGMLLGAVLYPQVTATAQAASTSDVGRYQMVMSEKWHSDLFVLDTATGRIWRCVTSGDDLCWQLEGYTDPVKRAAALGERGRKTAP